MYRAREFTIDELGFTPNRVSYRHRPRAGNSSFCRGPSPYQSQCNSISRITINSAADASVLYHEYGHFVEFDKVGRLTYDDLDELDPPGHSFELVTTDNVAWTEGWAIFFAAACMEDWYQEEVPVLPELTKGNWNPQYPSNGSDQWLEHAQRHKIPRLSEGPREHSEGAVAVFLLNLWDDIGYRLPMGTVSPDYKGDNDDLTISGSDLLNQIQERWTMSNRTNLRAATNVESYRDALLLQLSDGKDASVNAMYNHLFGQTTGKTRPSTATNLTLSGDYSSRSLSWTDNTLPSEKMVWEYSGWRAVQIQVWPNNEDGFRIFRRGVTESWKWDETLTGYGEPVHTAGQDAESWEDEEVLDTGTYSYVVTAYSAGGNSIPRAEKTISVTRPTEVTLSVSKSTLIENGHLRGTPEPTTEAKQVTVTVQVTPKPVTTLEIPIAVTPEAPEDYTVEGLTGGGLTFSPEHAEKSFTIAAELDSDVADETLRVGFGALPEGVVAGGPASTTVTIHDTPGAPTMQVNPNCERVTLTWDNPEHPNITGWEYRQRLKPPEGQEVEWGDWTGIDGSDGSTTEYTVQNLTNDIAYRFQVRAYTAQGIGLSSETKGATPTQLCAEPYDGAVVLQWPERDGVVRWRYRYKKEPDDEWSDWQAAGREITPRSQTVRGLTNWTETDPSWYHVEVQGLTAGGEVAVAWTVPKVVPLASLPDPPNEAPDKPSGPAAVSMDEEQTDTGADYTSTDPEGTTLQWVADRRRRRGAADQRRGPHRLRCCAELRDGQADLPGEGGRL